MASRVTRTYGSKASRASLPTTPPSGPRKPKRSFEDLTDSPRSPKRSRLLPSASSSSIPNETQSRLAFKPNQSPKKSLKKKSSSFGLKQNSKHSSSSTPKSKQKVLTQLHFCIDNSILRTCPLCDFSYVKGAVADESLHRAHCARVQRGMEWGREEEREKTKAGVTEVATNVRLKNGSRGRIICFKADATGKIGAKLTTLLETINLTLSCPPLTPTILRASKAYLFLLPPSSSTTREKIVGCVIAQRIQTAMAIASPEDCISASELQASHPPDLFFSSPSTSTSLPPTPPTSSPPTGTLIAVDTSANLFCHPKPLPTPLGIPRLFVSSTHRRQGIAEQLLQAAADTFVHGCRMDPRKGQVAFTQPTSAGASVMRVWGGGGVRIYEE